MYHHTQPATVTRVALIAAFGVAVYTVARLGSRPILWLVVAFAVLGILTFGAMTIVVDQDRLSFWFGPGWIRRSFRLADIESWTAVRNPWWYGWGSHLTPQGWLYNVGGRGGRRTRAPGRP